MINQLTTFLRAADQAACNWFDKYGAGLEVAGTLLAVTPEPLSTKVGVGLLLANAAAEKGCTYDPNKGNAGSPLDGCVKIENGWGVLQTNRPNVGWADTSLYTVSRICQILELESEPEYWNGSWGYWGRYLHRGSDPDGPCSTETRVFCPLGIPEDQARATKFRLRVVEGQCGQTSDGTPEQPIVEPITYTDADNGCAMTVNFLGYAEGESGSIYQIQQIEPAGEARADGGIISGCFFNPTIVVNKVGGGGGGSDDPPIVIPTPVPPPPPGPDGEQWWEPYVKGAITGIAAGLVEELLERLIDGTAGEIIYRAVSVCEKDAEGEPISEAVEIPIPELSPANGAIARLDAIAELLQAHKNFKQPICEPEKTDKPPLEGQWVTTRWISDEAMDHSGRRLRKLFRYRTKSTRDLGQLSAYWENFEWNAGPVCVFHAGAWWGTPQVWAESEEEGRRVLRFAAGEAGIDPDQVGEWGTSSSRAPRYGMSGTMKILRKEGFPWVASRDGAEWPNMLALQRDP